MFVLFLDADGVLNTVDNMLSSATNIELDINGDIIDFIYYRPELIKHINALCDRYNLKVVMSSTWRKDHELPYMRTIIQYIGLTCQLIDYTTRETIPYDIECNNLRSLQIQKWLDENQVDDYLVIDDMLEAGIGHGDRFIQVDGSIGFDYTAYVNTINKFDDIFGVKSERNSTK